MINGVRFIEAGKQKIVHNYFFSLDVLNASTSCKKTKVHVHNINAKKYYLLRLSMNVTSPVFEQILVPATI